MRVVWSFFLLLAACGGRTLGDPIFDDAPEGGVAGTTGSGGRSSGGTTGGLPAKGGAPALGGSASFGGAPATGGTSIAGAGAFGGRIGSGGTIATGGTFATGGAAGGTKARGGASFGGMLATGGTLATGGRIATGGAGGVPSVDPACAKFCDKVQGVCGLPGGAAQCGVGCSAPLISSSPECQAATRALLDCVNMALSTPVTSCEAVGTIALLRCTNQLIKANACNTLPPGM